MAIIISCNATLDAENVTVGAARADIYKPMFAGKRVALLSNHTGILPDGRHTLDLMLSEGIGVTRLLSPEHGFRGTADAGEHVAGSTDPATGLPVVSLYTGGHTALPSGALNGIDLLAIDLQDVGARFYTYHITMIKAMEGAARKGIPVVVLDRPNPLGWIVDGPVLDMALRSGVGRLPIPVIHGMTMGELALAANGEGWLDDSLHCDLTVVPCMDYTHATRYDLPVPPSPNLRTTKAIGLYPSLCLMEGTTASVGRGTDSPFTLYGHPDMEPRGFSFTPRSMPGAKQPPWLGKRCQGVDLSGISDSAALDTGFDPSFVIDAYTHMQRGSGKFFSKFFDKLAGTPDLRRMIMSGEPASKIKESWAPATTGFKKLRERYLLYPEK
ncbi:DUF1343 domain-containing protein [uncultured Muribaculum sp.]|uniref:exo-beta-N-acetylmuramidase NamZ family protein n=1 Tax=uncultured Muribaculum sp. TaxID=1918613 RepID=UPI00261CFD59|nr:DUF1343 domain-containing protein [uncultured Muribaculum sp.]